MPPKQPFSSNLPKVKYDPATQGRSAFDYAGQGEYGQNMDEVMWQIDSGRYDNGGVLPDGQQLPSLEQIAAKARRQELDSYPRDQATGAILDRRTGQPFPEPTRDEQGNVNSPYFQRSNEVYQNYLNQLQQRKQQRMQYLAAKQNGGDLSQLEQGLRQRFDAIGKNRID